MSEKKFDLVVIGTGPGGYVCAIRASQLGMSVAVVEKRTGGGKVNHGGTCLNVGCIPSKALLHASEKFAQTANGLAEMGIQVPAPQLDLALMQTYKDKGVKGNVDGIDYLFKKNKVTVFAGTATITAQNVVEVMGEAGDKTQVRAKNIVIATGSDAASLPGIEIDEKQVVTSTGALALDKVPEHLVIIGGGVIGLELGSVWRRLGAKVTVIEFLDQILPGMDKDIVKQFARSRKKQGFTFKLSSKVLSAQKTGGGRKVQFENVKTGKRDEIDADVVLVAIGRVPVTKGLGLAALGVAKDNRGRIDVNEHFETGVPGIFAIGDVIKGPMLAHKAEEEGVALAEHLAGQQPHINYDLIPGVVYTQPEVATVGRTQEQLETEGIKVKVGKFPFMANGRARVSHSTEGFVKLLADAQTDRVLGVHIIGNNASEMIHEAAVLMEFGGSAEDLARTCHAHPTLSEAIKEAALDVDKRAVHI
ncbi:MAG: dihydrolipoyl dehydrogenase [Hyphomicrobiaceae bacterium]|nr:dihydrolipoyl dehydrogenase [Hyphomicrobiaceae bacterium]